MLATNAAHPPSQQGIAFYHAIRPQSRRRRPRGTVTSVEKAAGEQTTKECPLQSSEFTLVPGLDEQASDPYSSSLSCHLLLAPNSRKLETELPYHQMSTRPVRSIQVLLNPYYLTAIPFLGLYQS